MDRRAYRTIAATLVIFALVVFVLAVVSLPVTVQVVLSVALMGLISLLHFMLRLVLGAIEQRTRAVETRFQERMQTEVGMLRQEVRDAIAELAASQVEFSKATGESLRRASNTWQDVFDAMEQAGLASRRLETLANEIEAVRCLDPAVQTMDRVESVLHARLDAFESTLGTLHSANVEAFGAARVRSERIPQAVAEYFAMRQRLAPEQITMPLAGDWAMTVGVLAELTNEILSSRREMNVLELGSGVSTVWASLALAESGRGRVVALEHNEEYLERTRRLVDQFGDPRRVELHLSPLIDVPIADGQYRWYDTSSLDNNFQIDLLVVDGPPGRGGPRARYPALPMLRARLRPGSMIILDDTIREAEQIIVKDWLSENSDLRIEKVLEKSTVFRWGSGSPRAEWTAGSAEQSKKETQE